MFNTICKKMSVDTLVYPWNVGLTCRNCCQQFTVTRRKKLCVSCKAAYCIYCTERKPDRSLHCRKCIVLTARPLNREELFNLKSRDLVDYLSSRHISTSHCIEKEDLVNAVIRAVNTPVRRSSSGSYPTSPRRSSTLFTSSASRSQDDLRLPEDGIRVSGMPSHIDSSPDSPTAPFEVVDPADCLPEGPSPPPPATDEVPPDDVIIPEPPEPEVESETPETSTPVHKPYKISDIQSEDDLGKLNVRQLKELLAHNRIDYSGCVERAELVTKVQRLYADYVDRRKDISNLEPSELCKICMDAPIECVLLECGHIATCLLCGKQLNECPICRQYVVRCVRTFKA